MSVVSQAADCNPNSPSSVGRQLLVDSEHMSVVKVWLRVTIFHPDVAIQSYGPTKRDGKMYMVHFSIQEMSLLFRNCAT